MTDHLTGGTYYVIEQLERYGHIANDELLAVLKDIIEINDDLWNLRSPDLIDARVAKTKGLLDALAATYRRNEKAL